MNPRRFHGLTIDHPGERERANGATSKVTLQLVNSRDRIEGVPLDENDLLRLLDDASKYLRILRDPRRA